MTKIQMTASVKFGESQVTAIEVRPLRFAEFVELWRQAALDKKPEAMLQRLRIIRQTVFTAGDEKVTPDHPEVLTMPLSVAKSIIEALDVGQGTMGKVITEDGDGITKPIVYRLGTPIKMTGADKKDASITELEFSAATYGDVEDVLAADGDLNKTLILIRNLATPLGGNLMRLPEWAVDSLTTADGVAIMREILPRF